MWKHPGFMRSTLYQHNANYGAIWKAEAWPYEGQTLTATACSDGTVRLAMSSVRAYARAALMGEMSYSLCQLFSIEALGREYVHGVGGEGREEEGKEKEAIIVDIDVQLTPKPVVKSNANFVPVEKKIPDIRMAIQALSMTSLASNAESPGANGEFALAYGGALGLLRIHTIRVSDLYG